MSNPTIFNFFCLFNQPTHSLASSGCRKKFSRYLHLSISCKQSRQFHSFTVNSTVYTSFKYKINLSLMICLRILVFFSTLTSCHHNWCFQCAQQSALNKRCICLNRSNFFLRSLISCLFTFASFCWNFLLHPIPDIIWFDWCIHNSIRIGG